MAVWRPYNCHCVYIFLFFFRNFISHPIYGLCGTVFHKDFWIYMRRESRSFSFLFCSSHFSSLLSSCYTRFSLKIYRAGANCISPPCFYLIWLLGALYLECSPLRVCSFPFFSKKEKELVTVLTRPTHATTYLCAAYMCTVHTRTHTHTEWGYSFFPHFSPFFLSNLFIQLNG